LAAWLNTLSAARRNRLRGNRLSGNGYSAQQNNFGIGLENTGTNDNIVEDNTAIGNTNDYSGGGADCRIAPAPVAGRALARDNVVKSARFSSTATA
jgi:hypothetical protein